LGERLTTSITAEEQVMSEIRGSRATKTRLVKKTAKKEEQLIHVHKKSPMSNNTFEQSTDLSVYILHEKTC